MKVSEAVENRVSIRAFRPERPSAETVRGILEAAARAPSGGNLQPWKVYALTGAPLEDLKARAAANPMGETPEYEVYPPNLWDPFRTRRFQNGEDRTPPSASRVRTSRLACASWRATQSSSAPPWACSSASTASSDLRSGRTWACTCRRSCCWR